MAQATVTAKATASFPFDLGVAAKTATWLLGGVSSTTALLA